MSAAKTGDTVRFHYTGTLSDGSQFDSSQGSNPMDATLGEGMLIAGFEAALIGMAIGDSKSFTVTAGEAYGERRPDLVQVLGRGMFPPEAAIEVGQTYEMMSHKGNLMPMTVVAIEQEDVTVDANHPLAGQALSFSIELVGI